MIASHIPIRAQAGPAAMVTAALRKVPGVWETASVAGPCHDRAICAVRSWFAILVLASQNGMICVTRRRQLAR